MRIHPRALSTASTTVLVTTTSLVVCLEDLSGTNRSVASAFVPQTTSQTRVSCSDNRSLSSSISTTQCASSSSASSSTTQLKAATSNTMDAAIENWVKEAGYGAIVRSQNAGRSDWASFRKVDVSRPPNDGVSFFVKTSTKSAKDMFEGEALGLRAMFECSQGEDSLRIPEVFHWGDCPGGSFLVMEYLELRGRSDEYALGRAMARMHLADPTSIPKAGNPDGKYGFNVDNTCGETPQPNPWTKGGSKEDWIAFYRDQRIGHQLNLAGYDDLTDMWNNDIAPRLHLLFDDLDDIKPTLLHGDLWSGNIGSAHGKPSIFDPAVYWGHHEAEWGMSWCASFGSKFWEGYRSLIPKDKGFDDRKPLYDAYHQLNHYNLFGGGYGSSARGLLQRVSRTLDQKEKEKA